MSTSTNHPSVTLVVATATASAVVSLLAGCGPVDAGDQGVEDMVESTTGAEVSTDGEVPADFPESVPLIEGEVEVDVSGGNGGWTLLVTPSESEDPVADAAAALEAAGFTDDPAISTDGGGAARYSNDEYSVLLVGMGKSVSYTVTPTR